MQQIYRRLHMPKSDFNKVVKQIEITLRRRCSLGNLLHIFRTSFPKNTSGGLLLHLNDIFMVVFVLKTAIWIQAATLQRADCTIGVFQGTVCKFYSPFFSVRNWRKVLMVRKINQSNENNFSLCKELFGHRHHFQLLKVIHNGSYDQKLSAKRKVIFIYSSRMMTNLLIKNNFFSRNT